MKDESSISHPHSANGRSAGGPISEVRLTRFAAFQDLEMTFSPGINILVGENGTGKTHIMKALYAACDITTGRVTDYPEKLARVFMPSGGALGRLVHRGRGGDEAVIRIRRKNPDAELHASFTRGGSPKSASVEGEDAWRKIRMESVYIPVKEMLANAPGFRSLYGRRDVSFEEIYADILDRAYMPARLGAPSGAQGRLLESIRKSIHGRVEIKGEEFFLRNGRGSLEFSLLAEGRRKLGLLWLLIQNGTFAPETPAALFWDEPESNLNPKRFRMLTDILLQLQREGAQIFLATHSYGILKEFDLQAGESDRVAYHSLFEKDGDIRCNTAAHFLGIEPNAFMEVWDDIYERQLDRLLEK